MTQYRLLIAGLMAAFVLTACGEKKEEAAAPAEQAAPVAEQAPAQAAPAEQAAPAADQAAPAAAPAQQN